MSVVTVATADDGRQTRIPVSDTDAQAILSFLARKGYAEDWRQGRGYTRTETRITSER